jgi:hypothetical protein
MNPYWLQGECAVLISQNLKDPGSMQIDYSKKALIKDYGIEWDSSVRSMNSFGAMTSQNFHCSNDGETIRVRFE